MNAHARSSSCAHDSGWRLLHSTDRWGWWRCLGCAVTRVKRRPD